MMADGRKDGFRLIELFVVLCDRDGSKIHAVEARYDSKLGQREILSKDSPKVNI
jgi:hypothetical protein